MSKRHDDIVCISQTYLRMTYTTGKIAGFDIVDLRCAVDFVGLKLRLDLTADEIKAAAEELFRRMVPRDPPRVTPEEYAAMTAREATLWRAVAADQRRKAAQAGELTEAQAREIASHDRNYRARLMRGKWVVWCDASDHAVEF